MIEIAALLSPVMEQILNKVITLISGKIKLSIEIKDFTMADFVTRHEENGWYNSLLVLIEVTNTSDKPYHISSFSLVIGNNEYQNLCIASCERRTTVGNHIDLRTGDKSSAFYTVKSDITDPLWRPYLQINQSEIGWVVFKFPKELAMPKDFSFQIIAKVAGYEKLISDKIN